MAPYRIRLATSDDWNALAEMRYQFRVELGSPTEPKSRFIGRCRSWIRERFCSGSSSWRCWVIDDGKQLLGHVCLQLFEKMPNPVNEAEVHAYLTNLYIVPKIRGEGLGRKLVNKALSWCRARRVDAVILWASPQSKSLYRRCGFATSTQIFEFRRDTSSQ
jgi:GNAT superfamily N-acetyltransferase